MDLDLVSSLDPECDGARAARNSIQEECAGLSGQARATALLERLEAFARQHVPQCAQCQTYGRRLLGQPQVLEGRSAIWGGATVGLFLGLIIGFFRESYWQTVIYAVFIGALLGLGAEVLARVGNALIRMWRTRA